MSSVVLEMSPHLPPSNIVWLRRGRLCKSNIWEDPIFLCLKSVCFDSIFKGCWWNLICTKLLSGTQISCSLFFLPQTKKMIIGLHAKCFKRYPLSKGMLSTYCYLASCFASQYRPPKWNLKTTKFRKHLACIAFPLIYYLAFLWTSKPRKKGQQL